MPSGPKLSTSFSPPSITPCPAVVSQAAGAAKHSYMIGDWVAVVTVTDEQGGTDTASVVIHAIRSGPDRPPVVGRGVQPAIVVQVVFGLAVRAGHHRPAPILPQ